MSSVSAMPPTFMAGFVPPGNEASAMNRVEMLSTSFRIISLQNRQSSPLLKGHCQDYMHAHEIRPLSRYVSIT